MRFVAASSADLRPIGDIVRSAQRSLAELGIDQWQDGYPSEEIIADDITSGEGYVILADDGSVAAYGAVKVGREADYDDIRSGACRRASLVRRRAAPQVGFGIDVFRLCRADSAPQRTRYNSRRYARGQCTHAVASG